MRYKFCPECGEGVRQTTTFYKTNLGTIFCDSYDECSNHYLQETKCFWYMKYAREKVTIDE